MTDVERISPCIPGFELSRVQADEFEGTMKVKVGAVTMRYESKGRFVELDESAHRAVMTAEGRDARGQGGVTATITSTLRESGGKATATIVTSLSVTGRAAQFGRGIMADVSNRLVGQFVKCLETSVLGGEAAPADGTPAGKAATTVPGTGAASPAGEEQRPTVRKVNYEPAEPVDLLDVAGAPLLKRLAVVAGVAALLATVVALVRRRR